MPLTSVYSLKPLLASDRLSLASRLPGEAVYAFTILLAPSRSLRCIQYASYSSSICTHPNTRNTDWHQELCVWIYTALQTELYKSILLHTQNKEITTFQLQYRWWLTWLKCKNMHKSSLSLSQTQIHPVFTFFRPLLHYQLYYPWHA